MVELVKIFLSFDHNAKFGYCGLYTYRVGACRRSQRIGGRRWTGALCPGIRIVPDLVEIRPSPHM